MKKKYCHNLINCSCFIWVLLAQLVYQTDSTDDKITAQDNKINSNQQQQSAQIQVDQIQDQTLKLKNRKSSS